MSVVTVTYLIKKMYQEAKVFKELSKKRGKKRKK